MKTLLDKVVTKYTGFYYQDILQWTADAVVLRPGSGGPLPGARRRIEDSILTVTELFAGFSFSPCEMPDAFTVSGF